MIYNIQYIFFDQILNMLMYYMADEEFVLDKFLNVLEITVGLALFLLLLRCSHCIHRNLQNYYNLDFNEEELNSDDT